MASMCTCERERRHACVLGPAGLHQHPSLECSTVSMVRAAQGMTQLVRERPDNPVEFLAHYLLQHASAAKAEPTKAQPAAAEPTKAQPAAAEPAKPEAPPPPAEPAAAASKVN